jgi:hypothetical protein
MNQENSILQIRLEEDEHYRSTVALDVANKWLKVSPQAGNNSVVLWQKIVSVVTDNFSDLESLNTGSLYLWTAWRVRNFSHSAARTRLVVKRDVSDRTGFKVILEREFAEKRSSSNEVNTLDYKPTHPGLSSRQGDHRLSARPPVGDPGRGR